MPLAYFRRTRRALSASVTAVFTAAMLLVCMPLPAAAAGQADHCAPPAMTADAQHPCDMPADAMDCCVEAPQLPAVPAAPQDVGRLDAASAVADPHGELVSQDFQRTIASALRAAPVHGHRHIDLPTLNAAFLI